MQYMAGAGIVSGADSVWSSDEPLSCALKAARFGSYGSGAARFRLIAVRLDAIEYDPGLEATLPWNSPVEPCAGSRRHTTAKRRLGLALLTRKQNEPPRARVLANASIATFWLPKSYVLVEVEKILHKTHDLSSVALHATVCCESMWFSQWTWMHCLWYQPMKKRRFSFCFRLCFPLLDLSANP